MGKENQSIIKIEFLNYKLIKNIKNLDQISKILIILKVNAIKITLF